MDKRLLARLHKYDWYLDKQTEVYRCTRCGWYREYSNHPAWATATILDVETGDTCTQLELATRQIKRHNCQRYEAYSALWRLYNSTLHALNEEPLYERPRRR